MVDTTLNLYRACRRKDWGDKKFGGRDSEIQVDFKRAQGAGSLYPDYDGFIRKDSSFRAPDVTTFNDDIGNTWIRGVLNVNPETRKPYVDEGEGVSLNKHPGKFGYKDKGWFYFLLPQGTFVPASLDVTQTGNDVNHYSIRCRNMMRKDAYEGALNNMARAAIAKAVELGIPSFYFS